MDKNLPDTELLIRYLDGALAAEEKSEVEERLRTEESLRDELENLRFSIGAVKLYGIHQQVATIHQEEVHHRKTAPGRVVSMRTGFRQVISIAAVFLLLLTTTLVIYTVTLSAGKVYNEAFVSYTPSTLRSAEAASALEQAYQNKNYQKVIALSKTTTPNEEEQLLVGLAYLQTGQYNAAIRQLSAIRRSSGEYAQDAEFYLSLAYLKARRFAEARTILKAIRDDKSHLYHDNVSTKQLVDLELLKLK